MGGPTRPVVEVVGLGPAGADLLTGGTLRVLRDAATVRLRTSRHPAVAELDELSGVPSFDDLYERSESFEEVYGGVVESLVDLAGAHGAVVYAVPGSPVVAERTVELLLADERVRVRLHPALSFLDLAWVRLGIDPVEQGVQVVDGHRFTERAAGAVGPFLVAQCDHPFVLADIKLAVQDPPAVEVVVLHHLGLTDERVERLPWDHLDRITEADHLTSVFIPALGAPLAGGFVRLAELVGSLRRSDPWKAAQTHGSLRRYLLEESYEFFAAVDDYDPATGEGADEVCSELGDVLYQVVLHAVVAQEAGWFTLDDVVAAIDTKLRRRHPAPADPTDAPEDAEEAHRRWERAKLAEPGRSSVLDGVPPDLPALARALVVATKAATVGSAPSTADDAAPAAESAVRAYLDAPGDPVALAEALGALVEVARTAEVDPEDALRARTRRREVAVRRAEAGGGGADVSAPGPGSAPA